MLFILSMLILIAEIYSDIVFDSKHVCAATFDASSSSNSTLAVVSGVSKGLNVYYDIIASILMWQCSFRSGYAMTGFRVGWTRCNPNLVDILSKMQEPIVSCGVPFAQEAAVAALRGPKDCVAEMTLAYKQRRDAALATLAARGRPSKYTPGGAFYLPVDISASGYYFKL